MRKLFKTLTAIVTSAALVTGALTSCGKAASGETSDKIEKVTTKVESAEINIGGDFYSEEEYEQIVFYGNQETVDYNEVLSDSGFKSAFSNFTNQDNPLQLKTGTSDNAYAVEPYCMAYINSSGDVRRINIWCFPVVADGQYIGVVGGDCRGFNGDRFLFDASASISEKLNTVLEKGNVAIFNIADNGSNVYGITEDDVIVNLMGNTPCTLSPTYEEIAQDYNVITPDRINERVYPDNGELPEGTDADWEATPEENIASALSGSQEEYSYEEITSGSGFQVSYAQFTMEENPLHLKNGTSADAAVIRPFKIAVADDEGIAGVMNVWEYLIASGDTYLGVISADCRYGENGPEYNDFTAYQFIADKLNEALESGDIAIFYDGTENYGIYEDGTVINLTGTAPYTGTLTFEEANKGVNLITAGRINEKLDIDPSGIVQVSDE